MPKATTKTTAAAGKRGELNADDQLATTRERIAARAFELYVAGGCVDGHDEEHWLAAEREILPGARESKVDQTLAQSFPASDPPSWTAGKATSSAAPETETSTPAVRPARGRKRQS